MTDVSFSNFDAEMRGGRAEACGAFLAGVPAAERDSIPYLDARLRFHYRLGEFERATEVGQALIERHPDHSDHRYVMFDAFAHLGWIEPARAMAAAMCAGRGAADSALILAEMRYALGLDDEADAPAEAFKPRDHIATLTQMTLCQAAMRRDGIQARLDPYRRAWTDPEAWLALYGDHGHWDLDDYWCGERPLPERLTLRGRGGAGDTFQWMRYLPALMACGVEMAGIDDRVAGVTVRGLEDDADRTWARMRLSERGAIAAGRTMWTDPFALFTALFPQLGYAPAAQGYLRADRTGTTDDLLAAIRARANGRPAVAVTWSSDESGLFAAKSLTLAQVEPLLAMTEVHWVVCQRGLQRRAWLDHPGAAAASVLPATLDFAQTAAVLGGLDAVVTNCSSIAHLSGGLGRPTFILASAAADWRWERFPAVTPWYPGAQLVRQPALGDWAGAVRRLQGLLRAWPGGPAEGAGAQA